MTTMRSVHEVAVTQRRGYTGGHRLLTDAQVAGAVHLALEEEFAQTLLEATDEQHGAVDSCELFAVEFHISPQVFAR